MSVEDQDAPAAMEMAAATEKQERQVQFRISAGPLTGLSGVAVSSGPNFVRLCLAGHLLIDVARQLVVELPDKSPATPA